MINKKRNKKLLICVPYTYPFNAGGGRNALYFAKNISNKNIKASILSLNQNITLSSKSLVDSVPIYRIPYFKYNIITKILSLFFIISYYIFFIIKSDIIIIYGNNNILYELIIFFGWLLNKKVVFRSTMLKDDDVSKLVNKNKHLKLFRKKLFNSIYGYFSLSPKFTESYFNVFKNNVKIFESSQGVETSIFFPVSEIEKNKIRRKLNLPENIVIIISVGYLIKRKGYEQIFEVLNQIKLPFLYVIVGDYHVPADHYLSRKNKEMSYLFDYSKKLLGNKILFTGPKDNVNEYLQSSDIYLINSKKEGLPNALLEAMACGICPISNNIAGLNNYILFDEKNCLIFNDSIEMQNIISDSITNNTKRKQLANNASAFINENCTLDKVSQKFIKRFKI